MLHWVLVALLCVFWDVTGPFHNLQWGASASAIDPVALGGRSPNGNYYGSPSPQEKQQQDDVCTTKACYDYAKFLKSALAKNYTAIDPCKDFSTYACGGWRAAHPIPPDESSTGTGDDIQDENDNIRRNYLEHPYPDNSSFTGINRTYDQDNFNKMQTAFKACMDQDAIKTAGIKPLQDILLGLPGPETYGNVTGLTDAIIYGLQYGVSGLVGVYTDADSKHPDTMGVWVTAATYGLDSKEYYDDDDTVGNYTTAMTGMFAELLGGNRTRYRELAKEVIDLEAQIARAMPPPEKNYDVSYYYNPVALSELEQSLPQISVTQLIKAFVAPGHMPTTIFDDTPDYYRQLPKILSNTTNEAIHGYLQWSLIEQWADRLHDDYRRPLKSFNNWVDGLPANSTQERWKTCIGEIDDNLQWIDGGFFVRAHFTQKAKQMVEAMTDELREAFHGRFDGYDWMSEAVKKTAKLKIADMGKMIGYPEMSPNVLDPEAVHTYYANVSVCDSYFQNGLAFNEFSINKTWNDLLKPTDRHRWSDTVPEVNAYYDPWFNQIVVPAGIIQSPYFSPELPEYANYGGTAASTMGHEMTHGFDNNGRHFDETGAYDDWWDNSTIAAFANRTQCLVDEYSKFTVPSDDDQGEPVHVDGRRTLAENIADSGGVSLGWEVWKRRFDAPGGAQSNKRLPAGMEGFSPPQLFFLAYAASWCYNVRPEQNVEWARTDVHAPTEYRIIGPTANSRGFRETFNCPVKEPTCTVW